MCTAAQKGQRAVVVVVVHFIIIYICRRKSWSSEHKFHFRILVTEAVVQSHFKITKNSGGFFFHLRQRTHLTKPQFNHLKASALTRRPRPHHRLSSLLKEPIYEELQKSKSPWICSVFFYFLKFYFHADVLEHFCLRAGSILLLSKTLWYLTGLQWEAHWAETHGQRIHLDEPTPIQEVADAQQAPINLEPEFPSKRVKVNGKSKIQFFMTARALEICLLVGSLGDPVFREYVWQRREYPLSHLKRVIPSKQMEVVFPSAKKSHKNISFNFHSITIFLTFLIFNLCSQTLWLFWIRSHSLHKQHNCCTLKTPKIQAFENKIAHIKMVQMILGSTPSICDY
jgi:hypothetical protein